MTAFNDLVDAILQAGGDEDHARLLIGEAAALLYDLGHGALKDAAKESNTAYKTLAERAKVVRYYQGVGGKSAPQIILGSSIARDLLAELPSLRWSHLRIAMSGVKDPGKSLMFLLRATEDGAGGVMAPDEFARKKKAWMKAEGYVQETYVLDDPGRVHITIRTGARKNGAER